MQKEQVIFKGKYQRPQPAGLMCVKQYLFVRGDDGKKKLLLRMANEKNESCSRFAFVLYRLDVKGNVLGQERLESTGREYLASELFGYEREIEVEEKCTDIVVKLVFAKYGSYTYHIENDKAFVTYSERSEEAPKKEKKTKVKEHKVRSRVFDMSWIFALVFLLVISCAFVAMGFLLRDYKEIESDFSLSGVHYRFTDEAKEDVIIVGCSQNYRDVLLKNEVDGHKVVGIQKDAFKNNNHLRRVTVDGINIEDSAFRGCEKLDSVVINNVEKIGAAAFAECKVLKSVTINGKTQKTLVKIGSGAFADCQELKSVSINQRIALGESVDYFRGSLGIEELSLYSFCFKDKTYDGTQLTSVAQLFGGQADKAKLKSLSVTEMSYIPTDFARGFKSLASVKIDSEIVEVGNSAFRGCSSLNTLTHKGAVERIGANAFEGTAITSIDLSSATDIGEAAFLNASKLGAVIGYGHGGVDYVPARCFEGCAVLSSVSLGADIVSIGDFAFKKTAITEFKIGEGVSCGIGVIAECQKLARLDIYELAEGESVAYFFGIDTDRAIDRIASAIPKSLTEITLNSGTEINDYAFAGCKNVKALHLPAGITRVGEYSFALCSAVSSLSLGEELLHIGAFAFQETALTDVRIPESVEYVGVGAFSGCDKLVSLTVPFLGSTPNEENGRIVHLFGGENATPPSSLESIALITSDPMVILPDYAFAGCVGATVITIPDTISVIGEGAFYKCKSLEFIDLTNATIIGDSAFSECDSLTTVSFGTALDTVGAYAFAGSGIAVLELPTNVTSIGQGVIKDCDRLVSLTVPFLGREYTDDTFNNIAFFFDETNGICKNIPSSLKEINITRPFNSEIIGPFAFYGCKNVTSFNYVGTVTGVGESAFFECAELKGFDFSRVKSIGAAAFAYTGIKEARIPEGIKYIKAYTFEGCAALTSVTLPSSLNTISESAFEGAGIKQIEVPLGVYAIGERAFFESAIEDAKIPATITSMGTNIFGECNSLKSLSMPIASNMYGSGYTVSEFLFNGKVPSSLKSITLVSCSNGYIYDNAFAGMDRVEEIFINTGVQFIESGAFYGCTNLRYVYIPSSVISVASDAFGHCTRLYEITNLSSADVYCSNVIEYTISKAPYVEADGYRLTLLDGLWHLTGYPVGASLEIPNSFDGVEKFRIPNYLFYEDSTLERIVVPNNVTKVGKCAFAGCYSLTEVIFTNDSSLTSLGERAFAECYAITSAQLPDSLKEIGVSAFEACHSLKSVTFPKNLVSIGQRAFFGCYTLNCVKLYENVSEIGGDAFYDCGGLFDVYNASALLLVAGSSDYGCVALNAVKVHTDMNAESSKEVQIAGIGTFRTGGGEWLLLSGDNIEKVVLGSFTHEGQTVEHYRVAPGAFQGRTSIVELVIKNAVSEIAPYTFYGCNAIVRADLSGASGLTKIGEFAFADCYAMKYVELPSGVTEIGNYAFSSCYGLVEIKMPRALEVIGIGAFKNCRRLVSITIYENVYSISDEAFSGCQMLFEVIFLTPHIEITDGSTTSGGIAEYAYRVFYTEGESLPRASFDGAKLIKAHDNWYLYAFDDTGKSLIKIGNVDSGLVVMAGVMDGATFKSIVLPSSLSTLKNGAFDGCYYLTTIYYGGSQDDWKSVYDEGGYAYFYNVFYYHECIHGSFDNAWRYDEDGNITTEECPLDSQVILEANCYEKGEMLYTCACGCGYEVREYIDETTHRFVDDTCAICGYTKVKVNGDNLDTLIEGGYITVSDFAYDEEFGGIVSQNKDDSTVSSFTITAKEKMTLSFTFGVSCQANGDFLVVTKDGISWARITGKNTDSFKEILEAGESVTISYEKNESLSGGDDQGYIKDLELVIIISEND